MIRKYIGKSELKRAFGEANKLIERIGEDNFKIRITHLESRYNKYLQDKLKRVTSEDALEIQLNNIVDDFLQFLLGIDIHRTLKINNQKIEDIKIQVSKLDAKLSFNIEIAKERINKLGECWSCIYKFENKLFRLLEEFFVKLMDLEQVPESVKCDYDNFKAKKSLDSLYKLLTNTTYRKYLEEGELEDSDHDRLLEMMGIIFEDYDIADMVLETNKFWLGIEIYQEARNYHDCYPTFLNHYKNKNYTGCLTCLEYQKQAAGSIEETITKFQEKIF